MLRRTFLAAVALMPVSGCGAGVVALQSDPRPVMQRDYDLQQFQFAAREGLIVSESESYYPLVDVVWRGDARGDRVAQIGAMFQEAATRNIAVLDGDTPINVEVVLIRFHGVTNRTRFSVGGIYNIIFEMTVRDARSGDVIEPARRIVANLPAPGGKRASDLDEAGQTQRVRVTDFLTGVLRQQLV